MLHGRSLFVGEEVRSTTIETNKRINVREVLWSCDSQSSQSLYQQVVYKVLRNPEQIISHVQRIHIAYRFGLSDPLYAALADLLIILEGRGSELSQLMFSSTRTLLTKPQCEILDNYFEQHSLSLLTGNGFSVFTQGLVGSNTVITKKESEETALDPLLIAREHVEYSQLDAAINTLEIAVIEFPERLELQNDLLELYKVTNNISAFKKMYELLLKKKLNLSNGWLELNDIFYGLHD